jgi:hypothetical protein
MVDDTRRETLTDEEIAAAVGEELPDRKAMSTVSTGCGPEEFGMAADSAIPPGHEPEPAPEGWEQGGAQEAQEA